MDETCDTGKHPVTLNKLEQILTGNVVQDHEDVYFIVLRHFSLKKKYDYEIMINVLSFNFQIKTEESLAV